ncbi:hypothetical protein LCGC14_2523770, partial [marine sediment metagenome]
IERRLAQLTDRIENQIEGMAREQNPDPADPGRPEELYGVEDPRITWLADIDKYAITYTAYGEAGPSVAIATTRDFRSFERLGPVKGPDDKDAAVLPVKFDGRWAMLHRPFADNPARHAHIWMSYSPDLKHWGDGRIVLRARVGGWWDAGKIGLSPPPIRTDAGWMLIYHGVRVTFAGVIYRLGLALLDLDDPTRVIRRADEWVFGPKEDYEMAGDVDHVVFPCGAVVRGDELRLYYGGADTCIATAAASISEILEYLL